MSGIYAALAAVMADVDHVAKRDVNQHQRFHFRGIDAVVNAVGPILRKHKVIVVPHVQDVHYEPVSTSTGKPATACRVLADYAFYAEDGTSITARVAAESWDNGDKAAPKAMSVAFRTALLQALALPTDEADPDSQTYERDHGPAGRPARQPTERPTAGPGEITQKQLGMLQASLKEAGIADRDVALAMYAEVTGRAVESSKSLTKREASAVIDHLKERAAEPEPIDPADTGWPLVEEPADA